ncbi:unnamed protein product [Pylaiella littoralis]
MVGQDVLGLMSAGGKRAPRTGPRPTLRRVRRGLSIVLASDCAQIPPAVGVSSLWCSTRSSRGLCVRGLQAWSAMNNAVELTQVMRPTCFGTDRLPRHLSSHRGGHSDRGQLVPLEGDVYKHRWCCRARQR